MEDRRKKKLVLAAIAGVLAGASACGGPQSEPSAPGTTTPSAQGDGGAVKETHGCGQHDGGSCGAHDDHKH